VCASEQPSATDKVSSFVEYFEEFMRSAIARRIDRRCGYRLWDFNRRSLRTLSAFGENGEDSRRVRNNTPVID